MKIPRNFDSDFVPKQDLRKVFEKIGVQQPFRRYVEKLYDEKFFDPQVFHSRCDNQGPTLILVKSEDGSILGGYTDISWESKEDPEFAPGKEKSMVFSYKNHELVYHNCRDGEIEVVHAADFIAFGSGHALKIAQDTCESILDGSNYGQVARKDEIFPETVCGDGFLWISNLNKDISANDFPTTGLCSTREFKIEGIEVFKINMQPVEKN